MLVVGERVTIAQIAEQAGVSVPTVSKVLNGRADVSAETRAKVESLIQEHGYRRRTSGTASSPMIDLVFHQIGGDWAVELIHGVEEWFAPRVSSWCCPSAAPPGGRGRSGSSRC